MLLPLAPSKPHAEQMENVMNSKPRNALAAWRWDRLATIKQTPEYQSLPVPHRRLVDAMVRGHDSMDERGMFVSQSKLAGRFGVSRRTIIRRLALLVEAGVFVVEARYRGAGTKGGRSTNVYRLNPALLHGDGRVVVTQPVTEPVTQLVTAEALSEQVEATQVEAPTGQPEPASQETSSLGSTPAGPSLTETQTDLRVTERDHHDSLPPVARREPETLGEILASGQIEKPGRPRTESSWERRQREQEEARQRWLEDQGVTEEDLIEWEREAREALGVASPANVEPREVLT